jgi:hypothetical protein
MIFGEIKSVNQSVPGIVTHAKDLKKPTALMGM